MVLACVLPGCGGSDPPPAWSPSPAATARPAADVAITSPERGTALRARLATPTKATARVRVAGRGAPGATVLLSSDCTATGCRAFVRADEEGRWFGRLVVVAPLRRPVALIEAYDPAAGDDRARVRVRLRAPAPQTETLPEPAAPVRGPRPRRLVVIGDSLARGTEVHLPRLLPGWRIDQDTRIGRPLAEGMRLLAQVPATGEPTVYAISLFTNDDPANLAALEAAVRASLARAGDDGCAIWATIARPPFNGRSYGAANDLLQSLALDPELGGRLLIVPWAEAVAAEPGWIGSDRVHATPEGYRGRAQMFADAARSCGR